MAASVEVDAAFRTDPPRLLIEAEFAGYGVDPSGRFLLLRPTGGRMDELHVVLNWAEELKRLVPSE